MDSHRDSPTARRSSRATVAIVCLLSVLPVSAQTDSPAQFAAAKCAKCHGPDGASTDPAMPHLAGLQPAYLARQMKEFAEGRRRNEDMAALATDLDEASIRSLAAWYGGKKPPQGKPGEAKLAATGKQLYEDGNGDPAVQPCAACHQPDGSGNARFPRVAGQPKAYVQKQLTEFKSARRATDAQMVSIAQRLSMQEIRALAEYIGGM